ncbi:unnamed protein product [Lathyrus sativus]|nr:unnamed protein product [Lathyrus sativus]
MAVSLEALAMAGVSCVKFGMSVEEWERRDLDPYPPPHLLAEEEEGESSIDEEECRVTFTNHEEKGKRKQELRRVEKCSRTIKLMARAFGMLLSLFCLIRTRD